MVLEGIHLICWLVGWVIKTRETGDGEKMDRGWGRGGKWGKPKLLTIICSQLSSHSRRCISVRGKFRHMTPSHF